MAARKGAGTSPGQSEMDGGLRHGGGIAAVSVFYRRMKAELLDNDWTTVKVNADETCSHSADNVEERRVHAFIGQIPSAASQSDQSVRTEL